MAKGVTLNGPQRSLVKLYKDCFTNTGGNDVVELLARDVNMQTNMPLAVIWSMVFAQFQMLEILAKKGLLK